MNRVIHVGVMVLAGISYGQRTQLHFIDGNLNAQRYRDGILRPIVVPFIRHNHLMFQHDNTQPHVIRICTQSLEAENVPFLPWPAYCTHQTCHPLSMFGRLWIDVYDSMFQFQQISSNFAHLLKWNNIPQATINSLINSMRRSCRAA